jgi:hypothetical protein
MKVTSVLFTTAMVAASVSAAAEPDPRFCWRVGQPCGKLKRAVDLANDILTERSAEPNPEARFCWRVGQPCGKAKRAETALAAALADANITDPTFFDKRTPDPRFCWRVGQPCGKKTKREALPEPEPVPEADARADPSADPRFCWRVGQPCGKVKRSAEALAHALAEPEPEAWAEAMADARFCWRVGQPCGKAKRNAVPDPDPEARFCWRVGQPCGKAKRALDQLKQDAGHALAYLTEEIDLSNDPEEGTYTDGAVFDIK